MGTSRFSVLLGLTLVLCLGLVTMPRAQAIPDAGALNTYIWNTYRAIENENPDKSYEAVLELESIGVEVLDFCIQRLPQIEDTSGMSAAFILGEVEDSSVVPHLIKILKESKFKGTNNEQADGGGEGAEGGTVANIERFRNVRDGFICIALGQQMARLNENNAAEAPLLAEANAQLMTYLQPDNTRDAFVKVCAALALGMNMSPDAYDLMAAAVRNDEAPIRYRAACILSLAGVRTDSCRALMQEVVSKKQKNPKKPNRSLQYLQEHAALALGAVGTPDDVPLLIELLATQTGEQGRAHTWIAIGDLADAKSLSKMQELLRAEKDLKVRTAAARTLFLMGDPDTAYMTLEDLLYRPNMPVEQLQYASQVLGSLTDIRTKDVLVRLLNHSNIEVRRLAVGNLVKFCNVHQDVRDMLLDMAGDNSLDAVMRQQASLAFLHWETTPENMAVMAKAARSTDSVKRCVALALQNRMPDKDVMELLRTLMKDKNNLVRAYATTAYGTTAIHMEGENHDALRKLSERDDTYLVQRDARESLAAIEAGNSQFLSPKLNRYWRHESNTPRDIWEEFWEHAMVRLLLNASNESGGPVEESRDVVERQIQEPGSYDPVTCRYTPGPTRTVREAVIRETLDPSQCSQIVITEMVKKHYYGPKKQAPTTEPAKSASESNANDTNNSNEGAGN